MIWLLLLSFVASTLADSSNWTVLSVKYGPLRAEKDKKYLFDVPRTLKEAQAGRWKFPINIPNTLGVQFVGVSPSDVAFTPMYDRKNNLAGAQFCQPSDVLLATDAPSFDAYASGANEELTINKAKFVCTSFVIVNPATIKAGGRSNIVKLAEGLWVRDTQSNTGYRQMPTKFDQLMRQETYIKQGCFPAMGYHYLKNVTKDFDCNKLYPWTIIGQGNDVHALAYQMYGRSTKFSYDWYDAINRQIVQTIVPNANVCLYDWTDLYTLTSIHVYFIDYSTDIKC